MARLLIVEDEEKQRLMLQRLLKLEGYEVEAAASGEEALERLKEDFFDLVLTDMRMPHMSGRELLHQIRQFDPNVPVIFVTAYATIEDAVKLVRDEGAFSYVEKPLDGERLKQEITKALTIRTGQNEETTPEEPVPVYEFEGIIGESACMKQLFRDMSRIIARGVDQVLIMGESGTGKELVAQAIHRKGRRSHKPFVPVNCSAIPENLWESELFGHERGAFTGADTRKIGLFEAANGGTILLDEIGDIPPFIQAKLLRVIQERELLRVGGTQPIPIDVCVIASTNRDLEQEVREGKFREDLYYRLSVVPLVIPPLRERRDDVERLAKYFLQRFSEEYQAPPKTITPRALSVLRRYDWPGNVRQLENLLRRVFVLGEGTQIDVDDLPPEVTDNSVSPVELDITIPEGGVSLEEVQKRLILAALQRTGGNQTSAAALLHISRRQLQYRMNKYGIRSQDFRTSSART